jgi:endonuclease/exonuclease/phosphatase family metal-dependent hydrolase
MAGHRGIVVRALTWNLFHGRDKPPEGGVDYRRSLHAEFAALLARFDWDVALLQEAPPRWFQELAFKSGAQGRLVKTSRNQLGLVRGWVADRAPDLIKSNEGGSNQTLVRGAWEIAEERTLTLARLPERRRMLWLRLHGADGATLCVANLHASAHDPPRAAQELAEAARAALDWSGGRPLLLGGDFNVRPEEQPWLFDRLAADGFSGPTGQRTIDHLVVHGMTAVEPPRQLPAERREVAVGDVKRVRLSDHEVVVATFDME